MFDSKPNENEIPRTISTATFLIIDRFFEHKNAFL